MEYGVVCGVHHVAPMQSKCGKWHMKWSKNKTFQTLGRWHKVDAGIRRIYPECRIGADVPKRLMISMMLVHRLNQLYKSIETLYTSLSWHDSGCCTMCVHVAMVPHNLYANWMPNRYRQWQQQHNINGVKTYELNSWAHATFTVEYCGGVP